MSGKKPDTRLIKLPLDRVPTRALRLLARPLFWLAERFFAFPKLEKIYRLAQGLDNGAPFSRRILSAMGARLEFNPEHLEKIPRSGATLVVANHPYGGIEGVALHALLAQARPDFKIMANYILGMIPEMRADFIFVDPFGGPDAKRNNLRGMREALAWLKAGHLLAVFPAGEVSSWQWRDNHVMDIPWPASIA
ncbi:MAG: glycerol acyltransferase, partial [Kiritimatiellaeota bacterium]|nr:glycerol acyltransferase [Kiritimatiellota bacterium]